MEKLLKSFLVVSVLLVMMPLTSGLLLQSKSISRVAENIVQKEVLSEDGTYYSWLIAPSEDSGYAGTVESLNGVLYAHSQNFVHTYAYNPNHSVVQFIYCDVYIGDLREGRQKTYYIIPRIDIFYDGEWHPGYPIVTIPVFPEEIFPRTYIGTYGLGKIFQNDKIIPFRTTITMYEEGEEPVTLHSPIGFWYYDTGAYNNIENVIHDYTGAKHMETNM
ncbi:MAG: hypothetical protein ACTSVB_01530 [Candidatus Heimdallarchaeaceae archaeon]